MGLLPRPKGKRNRRDMAKARPRSSSNEFALPIRQVRARSQIRGTFSQTLTLSDAQQAAFKEFQLAREKAVETAKTRLCANKSDLSTFEGHLALHQAFLEDRMEAVKAENPKLIAFYNSLNPEQKAKFEKIREQMAEMRGR